MTTYPTSAGCPPSTAPLMIDGRDAEIAELKRLLDTAGVVEIGARNPNVASYCDHWERRAEKAEAALSEREGELAEWRDIKEQMRCLTIYSKRDLQVKVAMQIRLREAAEKEIARLRVRLFANRQVDGLSHSTACSIWGDDGTGKTSEGFKEPLPCNCGCLINYERHKAASAYARLEAALSPSQESSLGCGCVDACRQGFNFAMCHLRAENRHRPETIPGGAHG